MTRTAVRIARVAVAALWIAVILGLVALGAWQVERRVWKLDLIARVDAGLAALPVTAPARAGAADSYRRVVATGAYLPGHDSFVQASTVRGPGWWVMTPLQSTAGATILVNRGYVPERGAVPPEPGQVAVTGLLRLSEPGGGFLRANDAAADRWYSRDVTAIATRREIERPAPYFIDADAAHNRPGHPVGGLTVVSFPNNHLVYAITWFVLALMVAAGFLYWIGLLRRESAA